LQGIYFAQISQKLEMKIDRDTLMISLGVLLICLGAVVAFTFRWSESNIPITGQSLAVLVVGFVLGRKRGLLAIAIYLILGLVGLPVFAKGASGVETFMGGSGGFLYGFLAGGYVCGVLQEEGYGRRFLHCLAAMTIGTIIILVFGIAQLTFLYGFEKALQYGFFPFWPGAIVKIILGTAIIYYIPKEIYSGRRL
jgi:biotin transport system substrate-specific component